MRRLDPNNNFVNRQLPNPARDLNRLVIAEALGEQESLEGRPLVGRSGRVFNSLLESAGIPRDGLTIINCLDCRPRNNVFPTESKARTYISKEEAQFAAAHCMKHHVDPVIDSKDWARVDLVGGKSLRFVAKKQGISKWRGLSCSIERAGLASIIGVPIYHPAYLMRHQSMKLVTINDLKSGPVAAVRQLISAPECS
jgi:uracil-DNA glycosylase